jgi:[ribosomal protein S5]-alanine N-acetyltransferase
MTFTVRDTVADDLPALFEIQRDQEGQRMAAFTAAADDDRDAYLARRRRHLADDAIVSKTIVAADEIVGSVACFDFEGEKEVTYWIRRDYWGRGVASGALAELLAEVKTRPLFGRTADDNLASMRVLEHNGFVRTGSETAFAQARQREVTEIIFRLD